MKLNTKNLKAIQDLYPDELAHCYGCGKMNPNGFHLKSYMVDNETIAHFTPEPKYTALPGSVYGGLLASILDCHGTGSAAAFVCENENIPLDGSINIPIRCVTASLKVDFKAPTQMGVALELKGKLRSIEGRKIWVDMTLSANGTICASGEILAIRLKD
ncbi:PaaI family thioesterase [Putridiphycobacter roseus]|uniref:Acyl-coenzyme A thioesterase THEM4 n=1 Tax=Putridiphycobacter roseus TaxID=2219161 RepID=A0A2W1NQY0_9FLAO|nr:PaaI family thioesterase [Putridiphycobacter roseus]PZE18062.1 PaaI family thioesterase [Putridiphycobacter roseus]